MHLDTLATATGDVTSPTVAQLAAGRHRLEVAIRAADVRAASVHRRRPRRVALTALAGAAAAGVAALVAPLFSAAPASAEEVLLAAADAAGRQVDAAAGAAYWHVTSEVDYPEGEPYRREIWQGRTGDTILRDEAHAAGAADVESLREVTTFVVGGEPLTWVELDRLPTDATALEDVLRAKVGDDPSGEDGELWEGVTGLLRESPASPALRRALWQVAAGLPGVELLGPMTDSAGRHGTAVGRDDPGEGWSRVVYIVDPADGTLLETRNLRADGTLAYRSTELSRSASTTAPTP